MLEILLLNRYDAAFPRRRKEEKAGKKSCEEAERESRKFLRKVRRKKNLNISRDVEIHDEKSEGKTGEGRKRVEEKEKCKTVAAAVVKGKIYFYCLKEIGNEWMGIKRRIFTLYCTAERELRANLCFIALHVKC